MSVVGLSVCAYRGVRGDGKKGYFGFKCVSIHIWSLFWPIFPKISPVTFDIALSD